jgi:hypothetical protein
LGYTECLHTKLELKWPEKEGLPTLIDKVAVTLSQHALEDVIRFDPTASDKVPKTQAGYCRRCGRFQSVKHKTCPRYIMDPIVVPSMLPWLIG